MIGTNGGREPWISVPAGQLNDDFSIIPFTQSHIFMHIHVHTDTDTHKYIDKDC